MEPDFGTLPARTKVESRVDKPASIGTRLARKKAKPSQKQSRDENVMGTNNSSIVSKRSVERLYIDKPHFLQFFVKKPIRRSPLINRGYWLRMHAVETIVSNFLSKRTEKKKIVVNLGCGYDPLPFKWLATGKYKNVVTFVDVDHPELMVKKRDVIMQHHELEDLVSPVQTDMGDSAVILRSNSYVVVGCDLRDTAKLSGILDKELNLSGCTVLCVAEVSVTYMDLAAADGVIQWATRYDHVKFCLLEQYLPDGDKHPFAQKMLRHFENLNTPLKCVHTYPNLQDQESRFQGAGYRSVHVRSLWDLWHDSSVVTPRHQKHLNTVEPFDEWEELALFSMHYFLLEAVKCPDAPDSAETPCLVSDPQRSKLRKDAEAETKGHNLQILTSPNDGQRRKFSAVTSFSGDRIGLHGGIGSEGRMQTTDRFQLPGVEAKCERLPDPPSNIQARACHTITRLNNGKDLLVGGRTSPHEAMHGCRLRNSNGWKAVHDLPKPLYRHCATAVTLGEGDNVAGVLVFGGRTTGGKANGEWYLWQENNGWDVLSVGYGNLEPRFGATIAATGPCEGLLLGGMIEEGTLCNGVFEWSIRDNSTSIWVRQVEIVGLAPRMGACLVPSPAGLLLIGGVSRSMLTEGEEILCIRDVTSKEHQGPREVSQTPLIARFMETSPVTVDFGSSRPLLVGHAAYAADLTLLIVGGGAVCFSFGAHWNREIWTIHLPTNGEDACSDQRWTTDKDVLLNRGPGSSGEMEDFKVQTIHSAILGDIFRTRIDTAEEFDRLTDEARPFVMEDLDIGPCTQSWTADELVKKVPPERIVTVHQAQDNNMNFQHKNFQYVKKPFGEFIAECLRGSQQYMRSLSAEKPADQPARFHDDFPELRDDFRLPGQLAAVSRNQHSSPLRISGPVNMWLHYDVMANVLCQIHGAKVVGLYPPADALVFHIPPGSSTSPINVFANDDIDGRSVIANPRPCIRAILTPGDVLYIPPLWLHSAAPMENLSVSINVFFKNFEKGYAAGRDVYGNRDLQPYENGRRGVEKMVKAFDGLPKDVSSVYLERLADELKQKARALREKGG